MKHILLLALFVLGSSATVSPPWFYLTSPFRWISGGIANIFNDETLDMDPNGATHNVTDVTTNSIPSKKDFHMNKTSTEDGISLQVEKRMDHDINQSSETRIFENDSLAEDPFDVVEPESLSDVTEPVNPTYSSPSSKESFELTSEVDVLNVNIYTAEEPLNLTEPEISFNMVQPENTTDATPVRLTTSYQIINQETKNQEISDVSTTNLPATIDTAFPNVSTTNLPATTDTVFPTVSTTNLPIINGEMRNRGISDVSTTNLPATIAFPIIDLTHDIPADEDWLLATLGTLVPLLNFTSKMEPIGKDRYQSYFEYLHAADEDNCLSLYFCETSAKPEEFGHHGKTLADFFDEYMPSAENRAGWWFKNTAFLGKMTKSLDICKSNFPYCISDSKHLEKILLEA